LKSTAGQNLRAKEPEVPRRRTLRAKAIESVQNWTAKSMIPPRPSQYPNACQSCGASELREIAGFNALPRVTSDSKPFRAGGRLFVCERCALVQKVVDDDWRRETAEIYRDYEMYHQSGSPDQPVFDAQSGRPTGRCEVLARRLHESNALAASGRLLDVGAGAGAMLAAFSGVFPGWELYGLDLDARKEAMLRAIPHFKRLFTVAPEQLGENFELITLVHSLEHFFDPLDMLKKLRERLTERGHLFVQVNNVDRMPFDLVVADHLCHFNPASLAAIGAHAGLRAEILMDDWVNKEISLLSAAAPHPPEPVLGDPAQAIARAESEVAWLVRMLDHARASARGGNFGIFGTSVAATWLAGDLGDAVEFFVDEDPARQGRRHLGRPILAPLQVPAGASVYLAFVAQVSSAIAQRLRALPIRFAAPG
jgi:SAM-dependent methyltransferase